MKKTNAIIWIVVCCWSAVFISCAGVVITMAIKNNVAADIWTAICSFVA